MVKWSELKRASDIVLAVWPHYRPLFERWFMQELIDKGELAPIWRERMVPGDNDTVFADHYPDREAAIAAANALNPTLLQALSARSLDPIVKRSLELKIDKALQAKQRLQDEEALMLAEALRRHADDERPDATALKLAPDSERYRQDLAEQLAEMPYLRLAKVGRSNNRWTHALLYLGPDGVWSKPYHAGEKAAQTAERAKIANGFDLSASTHWGKAKAKIRQILLPRANQLLQLASVQRMLAEALARGERVLVSNGIVFWYEPDGGIGWQVKETSSTRESEGATIWKEGTILSTNHGRLVVLPYIKENGEHVRGHTKNGPNDGSALPRHRDHYAEIPFSLYDGDLMIGLFGELPYE
ncbi:MAG: hypothetical protein J0G33_09060 [Afipia felis]|jgi:hypothetical protein|uniref:hypothetical protein n=1 Tax=Hyphomicrobiales TaxID=356 RepID=UPI00030F80BB|nr:MULTISPECIES: hypothetical protein [Hyphomicrobiales]MBN9603066.1 hypothetical protein [Afipia felis]MBX9821805.1 hypothetical protein [Afipia birgiae]RKD74892.1 hypothetical protein BJ928_1011249 [Rhizobium sp. WW_1]